MISRAKNDINLLRTEPGHRKHFEQCTVCSRLVRYLEKMEEALWDIKGYGRIEEITMREEIRYVRESASEALKGCD